MVLIDFEAQIEKLSNFIVKGNNLRVFALKSLDPDYKMRTIAVPPEKAEGINCGRILRITVEVVE